jgi:myosin heavy subunit
MDLAFREYGSFEALQKRSMDSIDNQNYKKNTERLKIVEINGELPKELFSEIIGLLYLGNPYVTEFFEGPSEEMKDYERRRIGMLEVDFRSRGWWKTK